MPEPPRLAVWSLTPGGMALALALCRELPHAWLYFSARLPAPAGLSAERCRRFEHLKPAVAATFGTHDGHVFIMSTGIVVRTVAPLLQSKTTDPAVVVVDEAGRHAISLVSGHIGGANALARSVARAVGAIPVITTATDVHALPAVDVIAMEKRLFIENPGVIKHVSMALLEGKPLGLHDPYGMFSGRLPHAVPVDAGEDPAAGLAERQPAVFVDDRVMKLPGKTLVLRPPSLVVGVGCNRHTAAEEILDFILKVLAREGLSRSSVCCLASVDLKQDEAGLLSAARRLNREIRFFSRGQLLSVQDIQTPSAMVEKHIGVKSVCEAAALKTSPGGTLIVPKQKTPNVTVAVVRKNSLS